MLIMIVTNRIELLIQLFQLIVNSQERSFLGFSSSIVEVAVSIGITRVTGF